MSASVLDDAAQEALDALIAAEQGVVDAATCSYADCPPGVKQAVEIMIGAMRTHRQARDRAVIARIERRRARDEARTMSATEVTP